MINSNRTRLYYVDYGELDEVPLSSQNLLRLKSNIGENILQ
jgi:hypothetical protein